MGAARQAPAARQAQCRRDPRLQALARDRARTSSSRARWLCLGATAAQALLGSGFRVTKERGQFIASPYAALTMATLHPSAVLRAPDPEARRVALARRSLLI